MRLALRISKIGLLPTDCMLQTADVSTSHRSTRLFEAEPLETDLATSWMLGEIGNSDCH